MQRCSGDRGGGVEADAGCAFPLEGQRHAPPGSRGHVVPLWHQHIDC